MKGHAQAKEDREPRREVGWTCLFEFLYSK